MTVETTRAQEYQLFLRSPEWRALRDRIIAEAHGDCECGKPATDVHHFTYLAGLGNPGALGAVCRTCHDELEDDRREDPTAHSALAPLVIRWAKQNLGPGYYRAYGDRAVGEAWEDSRRRIQEVRDNQCERCGTTIARKYRVCYDCKEG